MKCEEIKFLISLRENFNDTRGELVPGRVLANWDRELLNNNVHQSLLHISLLRWDAGVPKVVEEEFIFANGGPTTKDDVLLSYRLPTATTSITARDLGHSPF